MPQGCQGLKDIWIMPLTKCFNKCLMFGQPQTGEALGLDVHYRFLPTEIDNSVLFYVL